MPKTPAKRTKKVPPAPKLVARQRAEVKQADVPPVKATAPAIAARTGASGAEVLDRLFAVVMERRTADPTQSHSARLLSRGMPKVAQKFGEEAVECLIEAVGGDSVALVNESADVLYHLLVRWVAAGVTPTEVWAELTRREGVSGVVEKAARVKAVGTRKIP